VRFLVDQLPDELARARAALAQLVGAEPAQLAFVPSTTYGLNQLLQRLDLLVDNMPPGSEILLTNHSYNATLNLVHYAAERHGWCVRQVPLPCPLEHRLQIVEAFEGAWTASTRMLVLDHITSPSSLAMPLAELIALARAREAWVIVDGAHAPGLVDLTIDDLQPDAYVGNLHKWLCCPRGSAFLWAKQDWCQHLRPLVISHGANAPNNSTTERFHQEHDWIGTADPTPWLALPKALELIHPDREANRQRAQRGRALLIDALNHLDQVIVDHIGVETNLPMISIQLPAVGSLDGVALQNKLFRQGLQLPVIPLQPHCRAVPQFLRISCFDYNDDSDLEYLVARFSQVMRGLII